MNIIVSTKYVTVIFIIYPYGSLAPEEVVEESLAAGFSFET